MKRVPLLLLLLSSVLPSSHLRPAAGRPRTLPGWSDGCGRLQAQLLGDPLRFDPERLRLLPAGDDSEEEAEVKVLKRSEDPPLSIDLTFHLLRSMIHMAREEGQRQQAQINRKLLDEIGK